jgi:hypothetical protein
MHVPSSRLRQIRKRMKLGTEIMQKKIKEMSRILQIWC